jgi:hypothetical protein
MELTTWVHLCSHSLRATGCRSHSLNICLCHTIFWTRTWFRRFSGWLIYSLTKVTWFIMTVAVKRQSAMQSISSNLSICFRRFKNLSLRGTGTSWVTTVARSWKTWVRIWHCIDLWEDWRLWIYTLKWKEYWLQKLTPSQNCERLK